MTADNQQTQQQTHEIWPSDADKEQSYRNAHVLPCRQGGGIIFPGGLFGRGFRVDQDTFERYCADRDSGTNLVSGWRPRIETTTYIVLVLIFALGAWFGRETVATPPVYWVDIVSLGVVIGTVFLKLITLNHRAQHFLLHYRSVGTVHSGAFLIRRLLGLMAAGVHNYWRSLYGACIILFLGLNADTFWSFASSSWSLTLLSAAAVFAGIIHLCFALAHIAFKLRHGRAPTVEDLKPLHYPAADQG